MSPTPERSPLRNSLLGSRSGPRLPAPRTGRARSRTVASLVAVSVLALLGAVTAPALAATAADVITTTSADTATSRTGDVPVDRYASDAALGTDPSDDHRDGNTPTSSGDRMPPAPPADEAGTTATDEAVEPGPAPATTTGDPARIATAAMVVATLGGKTVAVGGLPQEDGDVGICDPDRDGWHFVMPGVTTSDGSAPDASDFGPVTFLSSEGPGVATFTDMTGPVAHFLDASGTVVSTASVLTASMTFPETTRVTGFVQFRLSHSPCGDDGGNGNGNNPGNGNGNGVTPGGNGNNSNGGNGDNPGNDVVPTGSANGANPGSPEGGTVLATTAAITSNPAPGMTRGVASPGVLPRTGAAVAPLVLLGIALAMGGSVAMAASRRTGRAHADT